MQISELSPQKRDQNRFNLYIDGKFFAGISINNVSRYGLYKGQEIENELLEQILKSDLEERFYNRVIDYIARGIKSEKKIREYIRTVYYKKRGDWFSENAQYDLTILEDTLINRLLKDRYINDYEYAKLYVESRLKNRPRSLSVVKMELISKGISNDISDQVLSEISVDEDILIRETYRKKFKDARFLKSEQKKIDYLRRKGFDWDLISKLFDDDEQ